MLGQTNSDLLKQNNFKEKKKKSAGTKRKSNRFFPFGFPHSILFGGIFCANPNMERVTGTASASANRTEISQFLKLESHWKRTLRCQTVACKMQ